MEKETRKVGRDERWTKRCSRCIEGWREQVDKYPDLYNWVHDPETMAKFIPDEYEICDSCLSSEHDLSITYDALDHLSMEPLCTEDSAIRAIRWALGETYVNH